MTPGPFTSVIRKSWSKMAGNEVKRVTRRSHVRVPENNTKKGKRLVGANNVVASPVWPRQGSSCRVHHRRLFHDGYRNVDRGVKTRRLHFAIAELSTLIQRQLLPRSASGERVLLNVIALYENGVSDAWNERDQLPLRRRALNQLQSSLHH